jgi:hypothetical protein
MVYGARATKSVLSTYNLTILMPLHHAQVSYCKLLLDYYIVWTLLV